MNRPIYSSVTRISDLDQGTYHIRKLSRDQWRTGDYVVGRVLDTVGKWHSIELSNGRMMEAMQDDVVVGALGARAATLEAVGDWRSMESDEFEAMTSAGLFGKITSISPFLPPLMRLQYQGHVIREGNKVTMPGSLPPQADLSTDAPVILIVGTSMSAGKTLSGRLIVHLLSQAGLNVVGAKLTGAARYRDVLSFRDAGAVAVYDFVDAGLPSSVCDRDQYRSSLEYLLSRIAAHSPDVIVAEAGASPLEPYNGKTAMDILGKRIVFEVLCAHDPYAVVGVTSAFARLPDLVAGGAANTSAGIDLVKQLTGLTALNLLDQTYHEKLTSMLRRSLAPRGLRF